MEKIIIKENERGFLFKNGKYVKMLTAGKYRIFSNSEVEVVSTDDERSEKHDGALQMG